MINLMIKPNYSLNSLIFFNVFLLFLALISLDSIHARTMQRYSDNKVSEDDYNAGNYSVSAVCSDEEAGDLKVNKNENQTTSTDKYSNQKAEDTGIMEFKNVRFIKKPIPRNSENIERGLTVAIDPKTGKIRKPRRGEIPFHKLPKKSAKSLKSINLPGGGVAMQAPPEATSFYTVKIGQEGTYEFMCTNKSID